MKTYNLKDDTARENFILDYELGNNNWYTSASREEGRLFDCLILQRMRLYRK